MLCVYPPCIPSFPRFHFFLKQVHKIYSMEKGEKGHPHENEERNHIMWTTTNRTRGTSKGYTTYLPFTTQEGSRRKRQGRQKEKIDSERQKSTCLFPYAYDVACNAVYGVDIAVWYKPGLRARTYSNFALAPGLMNCLLRFGSLNAFVSQGLARVLNVRPPSYPPKYRIVLI